MLRSIVPLLLVAAPAVPGASAPAVPSTSAPAEAKASALSVDPWWEKITVTMTGDGKAQGCKYESSLAPAPTQDCNVVGAAAGARAAPAKSEYSTITFERRFNPGGAPPAEALMQKGDKLLGRQVMALAIDGTGKVGACKVVAITGETGLDYGCEEATAERFKPKSAAAAQGFMTIMVYGHTEHVV